MWNSGDGPPGRPMISHHRGIPLDHAERAECPKRVDPATEQSRRAFFRGGPYDRKTHAQATADIRIAVVGHQPKGKFAIAGAA